MQEGRAEKTTARLIGDSLISLVVAVAIIAVIDHPAQVFFGSFLLTIIVRLVLIEVFHRAFQRTRSEETKALLQRVVRPPHEGAYIGEGGHSTLIGNLLLVSLFFWPFALYGLSALLEQTALTLLVWLVFVLRDLLGGGIFMDYDKSVEVNFGYNLNYMWVLVVGIMVALVTFVVGVHSSSRACFSYFRVWNLLSMCSFGWRWSWLCRSSWSI